MVDHPRRLTAQRAEILAELRAAHDHPTAAELFARLRPRLPRLSLGTVYRNLDVLAAEGLVARLTGQGAETRWDGMVAAHDHARCRGCGAVADVPAARLADAPELPAGFVAEGRRFEYTGLCAACAAERGSPATAATRT